MKTSGKDLSAGSNGTYARRRRALRLILRDREGTTAIEFGFVAIPFFLLLFGLIEIGLSLFADQVLNNAVLDASRLIRTGQAHAQGFDVGAFKTKVLENMSGFPVSEDRLTIDVERVDSFSGYASKPLIEDGEMTDDVGYNHGEAGDIVIVRALYKWPMISALMKTNYADLGSGDRLLVATAVFRNEPFPWSTQKPGG
ncbi:TadE/TadG family type IV pilus assembly protein [Stappia stellulata]|uniref:TadE/TadG family type IV pilus assembly protein n=1 Tax=Stappia stellulata TaxID=71235 RepID=UPI00041566EA|nr:TadE/TadG family type IV pilus assembly protein [Stappia stellulata]